MTVRANPIDDRMERVSRSLAQGDAVAAAIGAREALNLARARADFGRMARICMPLLEAQRMIRQDALDLGPARIITKGEQVPSPIEPGCYLIAPWLVGADALALRQQAQSQGTGAFVLTREPETSQGLWPVVGVGQRVVRIRIEPPKDQRVIDPEWFARASEALGDQAIVDAKHAGEPDDPRAWIVDDFLDRIDAVPEHEKFLMALEDACRDALAQPTTTRVRRRPLISDPYSF